MTASLVSLSPQQASGIAKAAPASTGKRILKQRELARKEKKRPFGRFSFGCGSRI
jgi:hypothetical protein